MADVPTTKASGASTGILKGESSRTGSRETTTSRDKEEGARQLWEIQNLFVLYISINVSNMEKGTNLKRKSAENTPESGSYYYTMCGGVAG